MNSSSISLAKHGHTELRLPAVFLALLLAIMFISERVPLGEQFYWVASEFKVREGDEPGWSNPLLDDTGWRTAAMSEVGHDTGPIFWIRKELEIPRTVSWESPLSLRLSGLFSAEVYWDGEFLASKGKPGAHADQEQPGPLDASFYLPEFQSSPGHHELALRVSANHIGFDADQLIHVIGIAAYRAEQTRSILYYSIPFLLVGSLAVLSVCFIRYAILHRDRHFGYLALIALCGLFQASAEVSRSLLEIPYNLQLLRGGLVLLFAFGVGVGLNLMASLYAQSRREIGCCVAGVVAAMLLVASSDGFDNQTVVALRTLTLVPACIGCRELIRRSINPATFVLPLYFCWLLATEYFSAFFLDSFIFSSLAAYLLLSWYLLDSKSSREQAASTKPAQQSGSKQEVKFVTERQGKKVLVPMAKVMFVRAAGNYSELVCDDKTVHLVSNRLGDMPGMNTGLIRIHRSIAVNPDFVCSLGSQTGSKYFLELSDGTQLPLSRYRVKEVRAALGFLSASS